MKLGLLACMCIGMLTMTGCGGTHCPLSQPPHPTAHLDIVDTAVSAGSFKTLVTAVKEAGLVETLKSPGPFTVFAPTDDAFAKLPHGALEGLLKDKEQLKAVLLYHVVPGRVTASDVVKLHSAKTAGGAEVPIKVEGGQVSVGPARVLKTDIMATNGVIHVIDTVLIPPAK
ncbi:MAG: fasciclin domain-containing protein [Planctomycetaceae bacterium]|nr:fasciclin domain-containing protein [Planctomycetaceae bacterium]